MNGTSVLSKPYKVYVLKTEHFDILFPKQSMKTAQIIEQNIETLYQKALQSLQSNVKLHIPILISPDSDEFSVTYTPNPYNRIKEPCEICGRPGYDYLISERKYEVRKKETTDNE